MDPTIISPTPPPSVKPPASEPEAAPAPVASEPVAPVESVAPVEPVTPPTEPVGPVEPSDPSLPQPDLAPEPVQDVSAGVSNDYDQSNTQPKIEQPKESHKVEIVLVVILVILLAVGAFLYKKRQDQKKSAAVPVAVVQTAKPASTTVSSGTDNASLASDVANVGNAVSQSASSLQAGGSALTDTPLTVSDN